MLLKLTTAAALGLMLAPALPAQTAAEQLQQGIFAQETTGNLDEAIAIYRKILALGQAAPRQVAASAQYRLTEVLLQKGDVDGSNSEFRIYTRNYAENADAISRMRARLVTAELARRATFGTASDYGHYKNTATGVELTHAFGTSFLGDSEADGGQVANFAGHMLSVSVWLRPESTQPGDLSVAVWNDMASTAAKRQDFNGWKVRQESVKTGGDADRQWLSAIADYTEDGKKLVEMLTWYRTLKTRVFFFSRLPAERLGEQQGNFSKMVSAAIIP